MKKQLVKKIIKISIFSLLTAGTVIAAEIEREPDGKLKGWLHNPGYTPPSEPEKDSLVKEIKRPLLYDARRKLYYYPKDKRSDSNDSKESDG